MSHDRDHDDFSGDPLQQTFQFDKFVEDLERRQNLPRDPHPQAGEDHNRANRLRDARNREALYNRIRWQR
jgi:hypothetical protein